MSSQEGNSRMLTVQTGRAVHPWRPHLKCICFHRGIPVSIQESSQHSRFCLCETKTASPHPPGETREGREQSTGSSGQTSDSPPNQKEGKHLSPEQWSWKALGWRWGSISNDSGSIKRRQESRNAILVNTLVTAMVGKHSKSKNAG